MTNFVERLRLVEQAAEDIYFAKIDRELIAALHPRPPATAQPSAPPAHPRGAETEEANADAEGAGDKRV